MPKGIPLTAEEQSRRRHEIFAAAATLFIQKGFVETSMREIAGAAGMGKSSLYDYFRTKNDILYWYLQDGFDDLIEMAREIGKQPLSATERLRRILHLQMDLVMENKEFYLKFFVELQRLGGDSQRRIATKRHAYQDILREIVEQGVDMGEFRPVDTHLATLMLQMALMPPAFTSRPSGTPDEMLEGALDLFLRGVQA